MPKSPRDYWRARAGAGSDEKRAYASDRQRQAVLSVVRLAPPERRDGLRASLLESLGPPHAVVRPDSNDIVVVRKRFGTLPLDDLPPDQREGFPNGAWDTPAITALYWCDGRRTVAEVKRLTELELGPVQLDLDAYFRFLARHGYVEIRK